MALGHAVPDIQKFCAFHLDVFCMNRYGIKETNAVDMDMNVDVELEVDENMDLKVEMTWTRPRTRTEKTDTEK
jgi:hypothetical protein